MIGLLERNHLRILCDAPFATQVYLVGGAVRDLLLNRVITDFDLAVDGKAAELARWFAYQIRGVFVLFDAEHDIARVVVHNRIIYDFARFRAHGIEADLALRDFTINAMAIELDSLLDEDCPSIIDPLNGEMDLQRGIIRAAGPTAFTDDPLRLLRAFRFAAHGNFIIDPSTLGQISRHAALITRSAYERITYELRKMLESPHAYVYLKTMAETELLHCLIPELKALGHACGIERAHGGLEIVGLLEQLLAEGTAFQVVFERFAAQFPAGGTIPWPETQWQLKLAALLHEVPFLPGMPLSSDHPRPVFSRQTMGILKTVCQRMKMSLWDTKCVMTLVQFLGAPLLLFDNFESKGLSPLAVYCLYRDTGEFLSPTLLLAGGYRAARAAPEERAATLDKYAAFTGSLLHILALRVLPALSQEWLLNGSDLKALGFLPGPHLGAVLEALTEGVVAETLPDRASCQAKALELLGETAAS